MKKPLVYLFNFLICFVFSQNTAGTFEKTFETNQLPNSANIGENSDLIVYKNRLYISDHDSLGNLFLHKASLEGSILWSKKYVFSSPLPAFNIDAYSGHVFLINEFGQSVTNQHIFKIDTLNGNIIDTIGYIPCTSPTNLTKQKNHVILNNGYIVTYACKTGTGKPALFVSDANTGNLISANEFVLPTSLNGLLYDTRISKLGPNSLLLFGRSSSGIYYFCKITNPVTLSNTGFHVLKQHPFLGSLIVESSTEYDYSSNNVFLLFRNSTNNLIIKSDTSLSYFNSYNYVSNNFWASSILNKNNKFYLSASSINVFASITTMQISVFDQNMNHIETTRMNAVPFNSLQAIPFRAVNLAADTNQFVFMGYDAKSNNTSTNNNKLILNKLNLNGNSICSLNSPNYPTFTFSPLQDSIITTLNYSVSVLPTKLNYSFTTSNSNLAQPGACLVSETKNLNMLTSDIKINSINCCDYEIVSAHQNIIKAELINVSGYRRIISNEKNRELNLNLCNHEKGLYFIKLYFENGFVKTIKVLNI
jgi:hypothetical protein